MACRDLLETQIIDSVSGRLCESPEIEYALVSLKAKDIVNSHHLLSASHETTGDWTLFSDAEGTEDQIKDVIGGGLAGERVKGPESTVEIEQDHLVRDR